MGRTERRAILLLLSLALVGHSVRWLVGRRGGGSAGGPPGGISLLSPRSEGSPAARLARVEELSRPLREGERINVDQAPTEELVRLPRVGPALAKTIVADRERNGPFGGLDGLQRVPGIGPGTAKALEPYVAFSVPVRPKEQAQSPAGPRPPVDLNRATRQELQGLPGIGPTKAAAIVAYRELHGPFATLAELTAVSGIGPATLARLEGLVRTP